MLQLPIAVKQTRVKSSPDSRRHVAASRVEIRYIPLVILWTFERLLKIGYGNISLHGSAAGQTRSMKKPRYPM